MSNNIIFEFNEFNKININLIFNDCKQHISDLKKSNIGSFFYRSMKIDIGTYKKMNHIKNRFPLSTPLKYHNMINKISKIYFNYEIRNGVFIYNKPITNIFHKKLYGDTYIMFPIGKYDIYWNPEIFDLFTKFNFNEQDFELDLEIEYEINNLKNKISFDDFKKHKKNENEKIIKSALKKLIKEYKKNNISEYFKYYVEASVDVNYYYLINMKYKKILEKQIWG